LDIVISDKIGRFAEPNEAFWHISSFLTAHPRYRNVPFKNMRRVQQAIALGNYCCFLDGKTMRAVATWRSINVAQFLRDFPRYATKIPEPLDGIFVSSLAALDRESLRVMIRHLRTSFSDQDVFWDRHNGKLGRRSKELRT
jgi:hypothetical protein